jgi:hypothetical protein
MLCSLWTIVIHLSDMYPRDGAQLIFNHHLESMSKLPVCHGNMTMHREAKARGWALIGFLTSLAEGGIFRIYTGWKK